MLKEKKIIFLSPQTEIDLYINGSATELKRLGLKFSNHYSFLQKKNLKNKDFATLFTSNIL